jgi:hypothetical protein
LVLLLVQVSVAWLVLLQATFLAAQAMTATFAFTNARMARVIATPAPRANKLQHRPMLQRAT